MNVSVKTKRLPTYQAGDLQVSQVPCTHKPEAFDLRQRNSLPS
jgi:hypothetical protein